MATVSRDLPQQPHLDVPRREPREQPALHRAAAPSALERIQQRVPNFRELAERALAAAPFKLADAQLTIAREYGYDTWAALKLKIASTALTEQLRRMIHAGDRVGVVGVLRAHPELLHLPVWGGNWGPPM